MLCISGEIQVGINSEDDRERYYLLYMQSIMAAQLSQYSTTTTPLESIITGALIVVSTKEIVSK